MTNGISGCSSDSRRSSTYSEVWRVLSARRGIVALSAGLASSTNQSQNAFHANSYSDCASRSKQ